MVVPPPNHRIVTLDDCDLETSNTRYREEIAPPPSSAFSGPLATTFCQPTSRVPLLHISHLPMADVCRQTLERIWLEFHPIIQRRGFHVESISELCCCGDGLDEMRRSRRLPKQHDNVWGYNQTIFVRRGTFRQTTHAIHLRLRRPSAHETQLLSWEDVAGTMAHELSHCVHQNHSPAFYQLMEDILEEHATNQIQNMGSLIYGQTTIPPATTAAPAPARVPAAGQRLGGPNSKNSRLLSTLGQSGKTTGGTGAGAGAGAAPLSTRARRELLARAAEKRCQQTKHLRRMIEASTEPCVIEILDDDDDDNDNAEDYNPWRHIQPSASATSSNNQQTLLATNSPSTQDMQNQWECHRCTFHNHPLLLKCEICQTERIIVISDVV